MKTTKPALCALLISAVSLCTALSAQDMPDSPGATPNRRTNESAGSTLARHDRGFLEKAAASGMKEVAVSQAVVSQLSNPEVRRFAEMMISDHSGANSELTMLASRKGVSLPSKEMKVAEKWSKKSEKADNIDKDYMKEMVSDHEDAVDLFEKATRSEDSEVAAFASKTLPTLRAHLQQAKALKDRLD